MKRTGQRHSHWGWEKLFFPLQDSLHHISPPPPTLNSLPALPPPPTHTFGTRRTRYCPLDSRPALDRGDKCALTGQWPHTRTHGHLRTAGLQKGWAEKHGGGPALASCTSSVQTSSAGPEFFVLSGTCVTHVEPGFLLLPLGRKRRRLHFIYGSPGAGSPHLKTTASPTNYQDSGTPVQGGEAREARCQV